MIFESVVVGVDGSDAGLDACRLANKLRAPAGRLHAVAVAETAYAVHAGFAAPEWAWRLRAEAQTAVDEVLREFQDDARVQAEVEVGYAAQALLYTARRLDADVIALGAHGLGRTAGIVLGSVATRIIHEAPCSVLIARGEFDAKHFPRNIIVGVDGSDAATEAATVAELLAELTGARVRHVMATGERGVPKGQAVRAEQDPQRAVPALLDHSREADLLVVGSRGLHGLASLGSVAERVAHQAKCPVLIVRHSTGSGAGRTPITFETVSA